VDTIIYVGRKPKRHENREQRKLQIEVPASISVKFASARRPKWARKAHILDRHGDPAGVVNY
jgi:hypothetical protein